ncbi:hypothetical protein QN360_14735 [Glaciimonas sp. CA11.2]|uniref:hypothetical protein n=1 Tax=unclassified Glaciimonas TaxID=2644401 RepID=UPI002AB44E7B|nr:MULTISPECIES: hypothetical protein [unclassified Glaciimonas]MDY7547910.1 hypothetical protein [Glaciimonas sp. CA11.2]MEB0081803.1 hypothetical protein [Glaciimonas sp. Gout2]MEB0164156.1 hypothetical protein [Glaciimonas sp. CA11.2]
MSVTHPKRALSNGGCRSRPHAQRGFALMTAIFLLVVLAGLGAVMVTLSTVQQTTSAQDLQGSRAYQAARTGIEWGVYQAMKPEQTNLPSGQTPYVCPANPTTLSHLAGALTGFSVRVDCTSTTYTEGPNQIGAMQFIVTASLGTPRSTQYVERQMSATISTCRTAGVPCIE